MAKATLCILVLLGLLATSAHAQADVRGGFAIGVSSDSPEMGLHALLKVEHSPTPAVRLRLEGMFQELYGNGFFGLGSLVWSPVRSAVSPYLLGSAGVAATEGEFVWGFGAGAEADTPEGTPLFLEFRVFPDPLRSGEFMTASLGVHF